MRDASGDSVMAYHFVCSAVNVATAEAKALLYGLKLCNQLDVSIDLVEGDCLQVIQSPQLRKIMVWQSVEIVSMICEQLRGAHVTHVSREINSVADGLAKMKGGNMVFGNNFKVEGVCCKSIRCLPADATRKVDAEKSRLPYYKQLK